MTRNVIGALSLSVVALLGSDAYATGAPEIVNPPTPFDAPAILELLPDLEAWLTEHSDYPPAERPLAAIAFVHAGRQLDIEGRAVELGAQMRGAYVETTAVIFLIGQWSAASTYDQSVLLHELAHHRQAEARHWYCPQAMEWEAYVLQERWLAERGIDPQFAWMQILLDSSCAVRDHHPD